MNTETTPALKKIKLKPIYQMTGPPATIATRLNVVRDSIADRIAALREERHTAYLQVLADLAKHPDVLPIGTKFLYWHAHKSKRQEFEIVDVTVRPIFETWDLVYKCRAADGSERMVDAGSMEELPAAPACPGDCATCERKEVARG